MKSRRLYLILVSLVFLSGTIDLNNLEDYANQYVPSYITKDNMPALNPTSDAGATLGRVLFYDKKLSVDYSVACANCHMQQYAFSDTAVQSMGMKALSSRHSMRLVNMRFADDERVLWTKAIANLEDHNIKPIKGDNSMGFSGLAGAPDIDSLITRMEQTVYYPLLFDAAFGSPGISELKITGALSQFVRSIQSFDSKYDSGRAAVSHDSVYFPNFSVEENLGKMLFISDPLFDSIPDTVSNRIGGGVGCASCHRPPEFDIDPNSLNNGLATELNGGFNPLIFRSPTLRDMLGPDGEINSPFMHDGGAYVSAGDVNAMLDHYNHVVPAAGTDPRLVPSGYGQRLHLTQNERAQLLAFFKTLTGSDLYTDSRWSDPFGSSNSPLIPSVPVVEHQADAETTTAYFPATFQTNEHMINSIQIDEGFYLTIYNLSGQAVRSSSSATTSMINIQNLSPAIYIVNLTDITSGRSYSKKVLKK